MKDKFGKAIKKGDWILVQWIDKTWTTEHIKSIYKSYLYYSLDFDGYGSLLDSKDVIKLDKRNKNRQAQILLYKIEGYDIR